MMEIRREAVLRSRGGGGFRPHTLFTLPLLYLYAKIIIYIHVVNHLWRVE